MTCHRCGKAEATAFYRMDPDLPTLGFCEPCRTQALAELNGWLKPFKKHVTKEWYEAVSRKDEPEDFGSR